MKKLFVSLMAAVMLMSSIGLVSLAADETDVYKASDAWYEPTGDASVTVNTYNGHTEWRWERNDVGNAWSDLTNFKTSKPNFGMVPANVIGTSNRIAGYAWTTPSGVATSPGVGEGWMVPTLSTGHGEYAVSKTFTAPMSGTVELSTEDDYIYGGSNNPTASDFLPAFICITVNNVQIWPANGYEMRMPDDKEQKYKFDVISTEINKGDKLRFEVYNGDETEQKNKYVYWKPVVTYTSKIEEYNSYDALAADIDAKQENEKDEWSWKVARGDNKLTAFDNFKGVSTTATMHLFGMPKNADGTYKYDHQGDSKTESDKTPAFYSTQNESSANGYNAMSKYWMRTYANNGGGNAYSSVAKVFTAPKAGKISITAIDADGNAKIYGKRVATSNISGANIFIQKVTDGKLPSATDTAGALYNHKFTFEGTTSKTEAIPIEFAPITVDITEGEQLWFIVTSGDTTNGNAKFVHWNPVVTYLEDPSEPVDVTFTEQAEYRYEGTNEAGEDEGSVRFLAMPEAADGSAAADIEQYGYWFVNADNLEIKSDIHDNNEGDEKLELGDTFYYTANNMNIKNAALVGFYAIPWVKISGRVSAGNAFTYTGELSKEKGKVIKSNPADN